MAKFIPNPNGFNELMRSENVKNGVLHYADELLDFAQDDVPVDTGELAASGHVREDLYGYSVTYGTDHSIYVHEGTKNQPADPWLARAVMRLAGAEPADE